MSFNFKDLLQNYVFSFWFENFKTLKSDGERHKY